MADAIYNNQNIFAVTSEMVEDLKQRALASPRKRFRLCMHHSNEHQTHEMIIVFHKDTFMPPHRHPHGKSESYHVIDGSMRVCFFNDNGKLINALEMKKFGNGFPFLYRLSSNIWHMPVPTSEWLLYHETYTGPFMKDIDVEFPEWAPKEDDKKQVKQFLDVLWSEINKGKVF